MNVEQSTAVRLENYYDFSQTVISRAADLADRQARFSTYADFFDFVGINQENTTLEFMDIKPKDFDPNEVIVAHLSMANRLNPHNMYGVAGIAAMNPDKRVMAFSNPSAPGNRHGVLSISDRRIVARGDFRPAVERVVRRLEAEKVQKVSHVGGSYGADLAMAASRYDVSEVNKIVAVEPVTAVARFVGKLGLEFNSSAKQLHQYIDKNSIENYEDAFALAEGKFAFSLGLMRATNIAISRGLSRGKFYDTAKQTLDGNRAKLTLAWGTKSELCDLEAIRRSSAKLVLAHTGRISTIELPGQYHAMGNDMALMNAIVATAFEN